MKTFVISALIAAAPCAAFAQDGTVFGAERVTHPDRAQSVLRLAVSCEPADQNSDLADRPESWSLLVSGKRIGEVGRVSPSSPDDVPLDLFLVIPRDMTMLDAHDELVRQLGSLPYYLAAMGHRRHRIHLISYSGCGDGGLIAHSGASLDRGVLSGRPQEMASVIETIVQETNASGASCGRNFEGLPFKKLIEDLGALLSGYEGMSKRDRGRLLFILHDGRNSKDAPNLRDASIDRLLSAVDRMVILQPDIAPMIWAREVYRGTGPAGRLAKRFFSQRIAADLHQDCVELRGREACNAADQKELRNKAASDVLATISPRTLTGSINHQQFVTRASLINLLSGSAEIGSKKYAVSADEVDRAFLRPTGLDLLGCRLDEAGKGGLEILGGRPGQKVACATEASSGDLAEIVHRNSPFAKSRTVELCLDEKREQLQGEISYRLEMDGRVCAAGTRTLNDAIDSGDRLAAASIVASVCGVVPKQEIAAVEIEEPSRFGTIKWLALASVAGAMLGVVLLRKRL